MVECVRFFNDIQFLNGRQPFENRMAKTSVCLLLSVFKCPVFGSLLYHKCPCHIVILDQNLSFSVLKMKKEASPSIELMVS